MSKPNKLAQALFEPADRGEWTLPDELIAYRDVAARLDDALTQVQPPKGSPRSWPMPSRQPSGPTTRRIST